MHKLYKKDETLFAIVWIVAYVVIFGTIRGSAGDCSPLSTGVMLLFAGAIALFLGKNGLWQKYGLTSWPKAKEYLFFIPFVLMISVNLWTGFAPEHDPVELLFALVTMALVGFVEEIIFRGFLFKGMAKSNIKSAVIVSAVTFGAGHIVNLLTGQGTVDTLLQMCYAIAIGFSFVLMFHKSGSLLPCIVTHSLIDMTSLFSNSSLPEDVQRIYNLSGSVFLIAAAAGYSIFLAKKRENASLN